MSTVMSESSDEDVPPLEDMTEALDKLKLRGTQKQNGNDTLSETTAPSGDRLSRPPSQSTTGPTQTSRPPVEKAQSQEPQTFGGMKPQKPQTFGGLKKGFLFGGASQRKPATRDQDKGLSHAAPPSDPAIIAPTEPRDRSLEMSEVQEAMKAGNAFLQNKDWVTEDLLAKVENNPELASRLSDPTFAQALSEMQTDPGAAIAKYGSNPEMAKVLQQFLGILGDHFTSLDNQTSPTQSGSGPQIQTQDRSGSDIGLSVQSSTDPKQPTAADDQRMQQILTDPEVRDVLQEPQIQKLIQLLREDPEKAQTLLHNTSDVGLQRKIKVLVDCGLLQFQR